MARFLRSLSIPFLAGRMIFAHKRGFSVKRQAESESGAIVADTLPFSGGRFLALQGQKLSCLVFISLQDAGAY